MFRHFSLFLALRYLQPKRTFVSVITIISILGVALGVTALVVVISVMRGFEEEIKKLIIGFEPHVAVTYYPNENIPDHQRVSWQELQIQLAGVEGVTDASPYMQAPVLIERLGEDGKAIPGGSAEPIGMFAFPSRPDDPLYQKFSTLPLLDQEAYFFPGGSGDTNTLDLPIPDPITPDDASAGTGDEPVLPALPLLDPESLEPTLIKPEFDLGGPFGGPKIVIGEFVAERLGVALGDRLLVYDPNKLRFLVQELRRQEDDPARTEEEKKEAEGRIKEREEQTLPIEVTITAVFKNPRYGGQVLLSLITAQELFGYSDSDRVGGVAVELDDPYGVEAFKQRLADQMLTPLPWGWGMTNWIERHEAEFAIIQSERAMLYLVLFILVLVGAFCVMNTMITVTVQKRKEIGVIGALGARVNQVVWIFLAQGIVVGVIGTVLGLGLGLSVLFFRNDLRKIISDLFDIQIFDERIYGVAEIPSKLLAQDVIYITSGSFLLCSIAALIPAYMAAKVHPAQTLRSD